MWSPSFIGDEYTKSVMYSLYPYKKIKIKKKRKGYIDLYLSSNLLALMDV